MNKTESTIQKYIDTYSMAKKGDKIIIALSGGADSVTLLLALHSLGYECHAAHCNFHLRAEESMRDEHFVTELCQRMDVPLHKVDFDTTSYAQSSGKSIEMAARKLRYDFFRKLKKELCAHAIAVGHHKDDNTETMILNLVRGTGIQGLCGIQPVNNDIIRPLLCLHRSEIIEYLNEKNQDYVTDSTNLHDEYSRNKIRLNVMPELAKINPAVADNMIATIQNLNEVKNIYEAVISNDIKRCTNVLEDKNRNADIVHIYIKEMQTCISPTSVLHEIVFPLGFNSSQEEYIMNAANSGKTGALFYSSSHILTIDREAIIIATKFDIPSEPITIEDFPKIEIREEAGDRIEIIKDKTYAYIDMDKIKCPLYVRAIRPHDSFVPFGMKGRKLLSDYMTDKKYNRIEKMRQLVVTDATDEIIWLLGERTSEKCRIDSHSRRIMILHSLQ